MVNFNLFDRLDTIANCFFFLCLFPLFAVSQPNLEWKVEYPISDRTSFYGVQSDSEGNLLYGILDNGEWKILKYDNSGMLLGEFSYEFPDKIDDDIKSFIVDSDDNIIAVGSTTTQYFSDGFDFYRIEKELMVVKFSTNGNVLWTYTKAGSEWSNNYLTGADVDDNNNIYITGTYTGSTTRDAISIMLDEDGNQLWEQVYPEVFPWIIKFIDGDIITVGRTGGGRNSNLHFLKYDINGNLLSDNEIEDRYTLNYKFDKDKNLYTYSPAGDYLIGKFNTDGDRLWAFEEPTNLPAGISAGGINDIIFDSDLNVYITGVHYGENYGDPENHTRGDILTIKLNALGQEVWRHRYENEGGYTQELSSNINILVDGSVIVTGNRYNEDRTDQNEVVYLVNPNGELVWLIDYDSGFMNEDAGITSRVINNDLYVIGSTKDNNELISFILKKYRLFAGCDLPPAIGQFLCD